jgi:hypothetical protein
MSAHSGKVGVVLALSKNIIGTSLISFRQGVEIFVGVYGKFPPVAFDGYRKFRVAFVIFLFGFAANDFGFTQVDRFTRQTFVVAVFFIYFQLSVANDIYVFIYEVSLKKIKDNGGYPKYYRNIKVLKKHY